MQSAAPFRARIQNDLTRNRIRRPGVPNQGRGFIKLYLRLLGAIVNIHDQLIPRRTGQLRIQRVLSGLKRHLLAKNLVFIVEVALVENDYVVERNDG